MRVYVGPRVLDLSELEQDFGHDFVQVGHQTEHDVIGQVLERKLALTRVARVGLAQHGVTEARNNLNEGELLIT